MAYNKRLQIEYKDINNIDTRIEVWQEGYAGAVATREYGNDEIGFEVTWGDGSTKQYPLVYGSKATFYFDSEADFEFLDFFTSNSRKNKVFVYKNNILFHTSFGEADTWNEPLIPAPYEVQFSGYDGLGLLKDEDFLDANKDYYEGEMTPLAILQLILSKTGLDLPLNTAVGIRPSGASAAVDSLTQVLKDVVTYRDKTCYEVLEDLFRGCRIFQRADAWWIISNEKWVNASITCFHYDAAGAAAGTVSFDPKFSGFWFEDEGSLGFLPALKQLTVKQDYGYRGNVIENGDFSEIIGGDFTNWEANGIVPEQRTLDADGNKYVLLPGVELNVAWKDNPFTKWIRTKPIHVEATTSVPVFSVDYALYGIWWGAPVFVGVHLVATGGTHYNLRPVLDGDNNIVYEWEQTSLIKGIPVEDEVGYWKNWALGQKHYVVDAVNVVSSNLAELEDKLRKKSITIKDGIPEAGELRLYLFLPSTISSAVGGTCFTNVELKFSDENEEELPTETEFTLVNDSGNNYVPDDIELPQGDFPDIPNNITIYRGGFFLNDGSGNITELWVLDGTANTYSYAELISRVIAAEMKLARQAYSVRVADTIPGISMVFEDPNNGNKKFMECGITYNDRMQTIEGRYVEVVTFDITSFFVLEKLTLIKKLENKQIVFSGARGVNEDVRVGFMDDNFKPVNKSGHLSADEFTGVTDPDTGQTIIKSNPLLIHQNYMDILTPAYATGENAVAIGEGMFAGSFKQVSVGSFNNDVGGTADAWITTDPAFVVGIGPDDANRANGFIVYKNGNIEMLGGNFTGIATGSANNDKLATQGYVDDILIYDVATQTWVNANFYNKTTIDAFWSSLSTGYIPVWNGTGFSNSQIRDNGSRVWIGGSDNGVDKFQLFGALISQGSSAAITFRTFVSSNSVETGYIKFESDTIGRSARIAGYRHENSNRMGLKFYTYNGAAVEAFSANYNGAFLINTTDNGVDKLQVNGTGYFSGTVTGANATASNHFVTKSQLDANTFPGFTTLAADYGFTDNSANWNTAYSWGNHATAGYLTSWQFLTGIAGNYDNALNYGDRLAFSGSGGSLVPTWSKVTGTPNTHWITHKLSGDLSSPGNLKLYGTDAAGVKGWYDQLSAIYTEGEGIDITGYTISAELATNANKGVASFSSENFTVTSGAVSLASGAVYPSNLHFTAISGQTALADSVVATDELLISDTSSGLLRKIDISDLQTYMQTNLSFAGGGISFGSSNQIPFVNTGSTDFSYSASLYFDTYFLATPALKVTTSPIQMKEIGDPSAPPTGYSHIYSYNPGTGYVLMYENSAGSIYDLTKAYTLNSGTPASAGASGMPGTIKYDSNYIYICVALNTWKRATLNTW